MQAPTAALGLQRKSIYLCSTAPNILLYGFRLYSYMYQDYMRDYTRVLIYSLCYLGIDSKNLECTDSPTIRRLVPTARH